MTTTAACPVCLNPQAQGLLDDACTTRLERELGDVASIVSELEVTLSRMARIGGGGDGKMGKGWAREKLPIHVGAIEAADVLTNTLTTWARDVSDVGFLAEHSTSPSKAAARILLNHVPQIRRHPAVTELVDEVTDAIKQARQVVDRPADKQYLGQCLVPTPDEEGRDVTCLEDVYASPTARFAVCKVCGVTHDVMERRADMLQRAEPMLFTVEEAARIIGSYGDLLISQSTIRNYVSSGQLGYHGKVDGTSVIRMGDLLEVIRTHAAKPKGRKLLKAS